MSEWEVHRVKLSELELFFQNRTFSSQSVVPISPLRIVSYQKNPRADLTDTVLYYIELGGEIIAFRTVWTDSIIEGEKTTKFGWCSGNWVSPNFRRKGLSLLLLNEMVIDWGGKLMFTNYAPESKAGYLKTNLFPNEYKREGFRFYLNTDLNELFSQRNTNSLEKQFIKIFNLAFHLVYFFRRSLFVTYSLKQFHVEESSVFSERYSFTKQDSLFNRKESEFQWIFNYPWLESGHTTKSNYPFSWKTKSFKYHFVTIQNNTQSCSCVISNRNGIVKLLYWDAPDDSHVLIAKWLVNFCHKNKIKTLTIIDPKMAKTVKKMYSPFVGSKQFSMDIYSTFPFNATGCKIFDGDGDYIFT